MKTSIKSLTNKLIKISIKLTSNFPRKSIGINK